MADSATRNEAFFMRTVLLPVQGLAAQWLSAAVLTDLGSLSSSSYLRRRLLRSSVLIEVAEIVSNAAPSRHSLDGGTAETYRLSRWTRNRATRNLPGRPRS